MSTLTLAETALRSPPDDAVENRGRLFSELGWQVDVRQRGDASSISLISGGIPSVLVTEDGTPERAASLAYSNEAPLTLSWSNDALRLSKTHVWSISPGDTS